MPWVNLDDQFPSHPKIMPLSDAAFRLHISGICYCNKHLTDGLIGAEAVPTLRPRYRPNMLAELIDRGLWMAHGDVYEIRDFLDWNRSKADVEAERDRKRSAGRKGAEKRWSA